MVAVSSSAVSTPVVTRGRPESQTGDPSGHSPGLPPLIRSGHPGEGETVPTIAPPRRGCCHDSLPGARGGEGGRADFPPRSSHRCTRCEVDRRRTPRPLAGLAGDPSYPASIAGSQQFLSLNRSAGTIRGACIDLPRFRNLFIAPRQAQPRKNPRSIATFWTYRSLSTN